MNWEECRIRKFVKETKADEEMVKSILHQSRNKLITDKFSPLIKETASTKFSNNYDSMRLVLEALAIKKGFKIYNHDCFSGFLSEIMKLEKESVDFDKLRKLRNSINYYGKDVSLEEAKKLINETNNLRVLLLTLIAD